MRWLDASQGRLLAVALVFLLILSGAYACYAVGADLDVEQQRLATVATSVATNEATGEETETSTVAIVRQDLIYRQEIASAYGTELESAPALVALINDAVAAAVAGAAGVTASRPELESFAQHAAKNSKAPELLAAIEQLFGSDTISFHRIYLAPKIINRKLRYWFSRDESMHQQQRASMQQAWALVQAGQGFEQVAKATGLHFASREYGQQKEATPDALKQYFPTGMAGMSPGFKKLLANTTPGDIVASIAEDDHGFRIVRLLEKQAGADQSDSMSTEEISLPKASFDQWYKQQSEKISIRILDAALKQRIQSRYGSIAWVQRLTHPLIFPVAAEK